MKFWEAMKAADEGKLVRQKSWGPHYFWGKEWSHVLGDQIILTWCFWEEWELYEGPINGLSSSEMIKGMREGKRYILTLNDGWQEEKK